MSECWSWIESSKSTHTFEVIPYLNEVSIGHALISEALFMGLPKTVKSFLEVMSIHEDIH